jgi:diadenylate cyclase
LSILLFSGLFDIRLVDVIDVILFAVLLFEVYNLVKGTAAIRIFIGIIAVYLIWKVVKAFQMTLLTEILGQFINVGVIALIVVFQPELRQFLLIIGKTRIIKSRHRKMLFWRFKIENPVNLHIDTIVKASRKMADSFTGALIVITRQNELNPYIESGLPVDARISDVLLETIFFKNSPLHDGAVIISRNGIKAARCILPVSNRTDLPAFCGLRHRAAIGITERSDAIAIIVSEQRGEISFCSDGKLTMNLSPPELTTILVNCLNEQV